MKMHIHLLAAAALAVGTILSLSSCQDQDADLVQANQEQTVEARTNQNAIVFPANAHPYGQSYGEWGLAWWEWAFSFDCATNPITDPDGSLQGQGQSGPVYFLAGTGGTPAVRSVTIPAGKAVFFPLICIINDYPCPDETFQPAPGQTLEEFLVEGANAFIGSTTSLSATLDGVALTNLTDYRGSTGLVSFTGNADLSNCLDGCITGTPQDAVSDGYWLMLKPLSPGQHTLHFNAASSYGFSLDVTYTITVN